MKALDKSRRNFFKFAKKEDEKLIFFDVLKDECQICQKPCITQCPEQIIALKDDRVYLDFSKSGCMFCEICADVCKKTNQMIEFKLIILAKFSINPIKCLSFNQTLCFSCQDACAYKAIDFLGLFRPKINQNCINCGFCVSVCPTNAVEFEGVS